MFIMINERNVVEILDKLCSFGSDEQLNICIDVWSDSTHGLLVGMATF